MSQNTVLLDPTDERKPSHRQRNPRPSSLNGLTVGLLDISKPRGDLFLNEIERSLAIEGATVKRYSKPTYTRVAPTELKQQLASECDVVVEALADWGSCTTCSVHDISDLENRGIPAVFIASSEFIPAARSQSEALGFDAASVFVPHPIQDRTDDEMRGLAEEAIGAIRNAIVRER